MLHQQMQEEMRESLRARDTVRLTTLRGLLTSFTNELVAKKRKPDERLSDEDVLSVIARAAKQRKDSILQFKKGGRTDLVEQEEKELLIIEAYLPKMMERDDIQKVAEAKKMALGVTNKEDMGKLMGAIMQELKGKADGGDVKEVVESLFN